MAENENSPSYQDLNAALEQAHANVSASEAHGILCGFICADKEMTDDSWIELILGSQQALQQVSPQILEKNRVLLLKLHEIALTKLQNIEFDFSLLLPDDDTALAPRSEALSHWCQGFIIAITRSGIVIENCVSEDARDALKHLLEISKLNPDAVEISDDEEERAYNEVMEYVRVAVLMVYTEIANHIPRGQPPLTNKGELH